MCRTKLVAVVVFAAIVCVSAIVQADLITGVTVSMTGGGDGYGLKDHLIDNSGMTGDAQSWDNGSGTTYGWRAHAWLHAPFDVVFDLGAVQAVDNMQIWNYLEFAGTNQGMKNFTLLYSTDNVTYTSLGVNQVAENVNASPSSQHDVFAIGADARYIKWEIPAGAPGGGYNNWGGDFVGAGEVRFFSPIPEPSVIALLVSGLIGLLAYAWRKRR